MRNITKPIRLAIRPNPILRFDDEDNFSKLVTPSFNRHIASKKGLIDRHAQILALSAAEANSVCLASNQIGLESRLIAISKNITNQKDKTINWINQHYNSPNQYTIYNRPSIGKGKGLVRTFEESISFPFLKFAVRRYQNISISYFNKDGLQEQSVEGPQALVFQQSQQQLNGQILLDWRINEGNISLHEQVINYFPKTAKVIEEYVNDLAKLFKKYPYLINKPEEFSTSHQQQSSQINHIENNQEELPFQKDFYRRILKYYRRQMGALEEQLYSGRTRNYEWQERPLAVRKLDK